MSVIRKILILSANPKGTSQLRLDEEVREIQRALKLSTGREQFQIICEWAVRADDVRRALLEHGPQIVHFSGHGTGEQGLVLEDETGQAQLASAGALARLFKLFAGKIQCVLLNACYSEVQSDAIAQQIDYVIGMNQAIGDRAAIKFAVGFYDALGYGHSFEEAYEFGLSAIDLQGISETSTPVLKAKPNSSSFPKVAELAIDSEIPVPIDSKAKRVFISYRSQEPDASLAQEFHDQLVAASHKPFMAAASISWGQNWVERIDEELKRCDYFLLLLSEQSASSDMVAGEVRTARRLRDKLGKPVILPVRVNLPLDDPLNYELRSFLQTIQQRQWKSEADTPVILSEILALLSTGTAPEPVAEEMTPTPVVETRNRPPLPVAELELPGGTMQLASQFYVQREPWESRCYGQIEKKAGLIRIKAPRQMGKTSLLARICHHATEQGYRTATLDFLETDEAIFEDLTVFLKRFCAMVSRKLGISPRKVLEFWDDELFGPKDNCNDYFEQGILADLTVPLFLGLDELDRLFPHNAVAKEFLSMLRAWN